MAHRRWFFLKATLKAFTFHPWRVILMSLFMGIALGLLWLSWDVQLAMNTYLQSLWKASGIPFTVHSVGYDENPATGEPVGPVSVSEWQKIVTEKPPKGYWIPWIERSIMVGDKNLIWVITSVEDLVKVRPWMEVHPPGLSVYRSEWLTDDSAWASWCDRYREICKSEKVGRWVTGHESYHILTDIKAVERRMNIQTYGRIEGRWADTPESFEKWRQEIERNYGMVVEADLPALARFRIMGETARRYLQWTGAGLLLMGFLTYLLIILLDTFHRRYEWSVWAGVGADARHFVMHFIQMAILWTFAIFVMGNGMYWLGKVAVRYWLPELDIRPEWWEGPVIAVIGAVLCMLAMIPAYIQVQRLEPASLLRGE